MGKNCVKDDCEFNDHGGFCNDCNRHICTPDAPYPGEGRASHPSCHEVGEQEDGYPGGDIIRMECPICETSWKQELPQ